MKIKRVKDFTNFFRAKSPKTQVYLHHTAGGADGQAQFSFWQADPRPVATCVCISRDGTIDQGFGSEYWAYHLGLPAKAFISQKLPYLDLEKTSIGIEICNWGWLTKKGDKYYTYVNKEVPASRVITLDKPYKGQLHWEAYTDEQIASVKELLLHWQKRYNIQTAYSEVDMWEVSKKALTNTPGVYTHNSVRSDKTDVYPHPGLIAMLQELATSEQ
jgi:N-acetyl-anhydromuramyl-L-alanine amidase AmpD